jgi:hypothetical protein
MDSAAALQNDPDPAVLTAKDTAHTADLHSVKVV